jgi:hypothetical protein
MTAPQIRPQTPNLTFPAVSGFIDTSLNYGNILNLIGQLPIAIRQLKTRQNNPQYEYLGSPQRDLFSSFRGFLWAPLAISFS